MSVAIEEILSLGVKERLQLIKHIWDIAADPEAVPLTVAQRKELDRRLRVHKQDPSAAKPSSEVPNRLKTLNKSNRG